VSEVEEKRDRKPGGGISRAKKGKEKKRKEIDREKRGREGERGK
jgi:hypothetical protein